jgi:UDP:flavonoid glycosyltransferase YjiC (YdhE family)
VLGLARFLWACFDGGGNVPPSLGIAHALREAGHEVSFAGRPEMVGRVTPAGFAAIELSQSYRHADRYAWHPRGRLFSYLTSPAVGEELLLLAKTERPDVVVIDAMFGGALDIAPRLGLPTAVMLHTFLHRTIDGWTVLMRGESDARQRSGFDPLPSLAEMWATTDLFHVNSLEQFDSAPRVEWPNIRHGAPILADDSRAVAVDTPWDPSDPTPLALISFSTAAAQSSVGKLQRALDALADLPVHVIATSGGSVDPATLDLAENAHVVRFARHGPLMDRAALVVTHGGHGTAMRALSHGVPLVCVAGQAADQEGVAALDQPCVAAFISERRVGRSVTADAPASDIRAAAREVLDDPAYLSNARRHADHLRSTTSGAVRAARRLVALAS